MKEFAGTMRHRELRETVSLAQLDRTRAPLYSALLPLPATACGDPATKAFLVFDTANCTHPPTLPERPSACPRSSLEPPSPPPPPFSESFHRETNREIIDVHERFLREKKIEEMKGWLCGARKVAAAIRSQSRRFNELAGRARCTQPFR